ncbi:response regulator transcription factor [Alkalihalobacillus trypoxylicola]|uniref:Two-component system response regulator n=1 Tax=Alkalihalobacillus trypoxylicola TaxID=519424 RepID=A0A161PDT1_9BACI|nr:response regulator transcription factor [Alkalihalobacillus trypoxylicola]KYG30557.1 two-component system response regulator [Alkalihalobacillus trypoxylicola]
METTILIVDDESSIVQLLDTVLKKEGFSSIYRAFNAKEALELVKKHSFDFIILDVMLPDQSGFELCPIIRQHSNAYLLFLTAKVSDFDKLTGFAIGADDYVTKPFNPLEIIARIKAYLRRESISEAPSASVQIKGSKKTIHNYRRFSLNELTGELMVDGKNVPCPAQVFLLLRFFCQHPNQIFSKHQLFEAVWGTNHYVDDNTVMVHIRRIREKIESNPSEPKHLITVRGLGYKFLEAPADEIY